MSELLRSHITYILNQNDQSKSFTAEQRNQIANGTIIRLSVSNDDRLTGTLKAETRAEFETALNKDAVARIKELTDSAIKNVASGKDAFLEKGNIEPVGVPATELNRSAASKATVKE